MPIDGFAQEACKSENFVLGKDLLKTPSGQMLQKLKELRLSINSSVYGASHFDEPKIEPVIQRDRNISRGSNLDIDEPIPDYSKLKGKLIVNAEDSLIGTSSSCSDNSDVDSISDCTSYGSFSIGKTLSYFQKYFVRQAEKGKSSHTYQSPKKCNLELLKSHLLSDPEVKRLISSCVPRSN